MRLKNFTLSILFICSFGFAHGQCEIPNGSFEDWITTDFALPDENGEDVVADVMLPEGVTSVIRFLFIAFSAAFDPSFSLLLENEAQELIGISQSDDASDGDFAVKLQAGYDIEQADIYGVFGCTEVPEQFNLDIKHFGDSNDSLTVIVIFDEGLGALPETEEDLAAVPAYVSASLGFNSNTDYETITLPVIENFEADVDTFYYLIIAETSETSYFLVDNVNFEDDNSGCQVFAPEIALSNEEGPICICNNLNVPVPLDYETELGFTYKSVILDEDGTIVSVGTTDFYDNLCYPTDNLSVIVIAHLGPLQGLDEGNNIDGLEGCYEISNELALETYSLPKFEFNVFMDGVQQDENISICLLDDIIETFSFSTDVEIENIAIVLINDDDEITAVRIDDINETTEFMNVAPGSYTMGAVSYDGSFNLEVGQDADDITYEGCFSVSDDVYEVDVLGPDDLCVTDVEEIYSGKLSIRPNYSSGLFEIDNPNNESYHFVVRDISGKSVLSSNNNLNGNLIDLTRFSSGLYVISFNIDGFIHQEKIIKI